MANPLLKGLEEFGIKYVGKQGVPKSVSEGLGFLGSLAGGGPLAAFLLGMAPKTVAPATYEEGESKMADEVYRYPEVNLTVPSAGEHNPKYSYDQSSLPLATLTGDPKGRDWSETFRLTKNRWSVDHLLEMLRQGSITEEQLERDLGREGPQGGPEGPEGPYFGGRGDAPERRAVIKSALAVFRREKARAASSLNESRFQGTSPDQNLRTWDEAFQADQDIAQKTHEVPPLMEGSFQAMDEDRYDPLTYLEMFDRAPYGEATPDMLPREARQHYQTAPGYDTLLEPYPRARGYTHGGYVGRGTMAGELGRRGDLSVREAGETMYERNKRLHGYDRGGYVHGRGTMPGELRRKGSLPVRVAGESMGEYRKHREDEDDVRPVRRTLDNALSPTLSRRIFG